MSSGSRAWSFVLALFSRGCYGVVRDGVVDVWTVVGRVLCVVCHRTGATVSRVMASGTMVVAIVANGRQQWQQAAVLRVWLAVAIGHAKL